MTRFLLLTFVLALASAAARGAAPTTPWERGGGNVTPDYAETVAWCAELADASPLLALTTFGTSPEGRDLPLVVADRAGRFVPAPRTDRTVVLVQACIHAGESCGKDAGMLLLRDLAADPALADSLLDGVTLLFIPIFNVDGHERRSPYGRVNQNGPEETGWRTTAANLNLNRDHMKADTPEMRAWLRLFQAWLPDFFVDTHATDGADYQYALTYALETRGNMDPQLSDWTRAFERDMRAGMAAAGRPVFPYVSFREWHDPRSGLRTGAMGPRLSQGYTALQNRPGLLIEAHMLKDYATRVRATAELLRFTLARLAADGAELRRLVRAADARTAAPDFRAEPLALTFTPTDSVRTVDFAGVEYEMVTSEVTGGRYPRFGDTPVDWRLPWWQDLVPAATARVPAAYLVPPAWVEVIARLEAHGLVLRRLAAPAELTVRTWRFHEPAWQERPYEGRHPLAYRAETVTETRVFPAGTVVVGTDQRAARVAVHLLDPAGPDALVRWGFFDPVFTRTEYVESYVIEAMIPGLLAAHPEWEEELEERKAADPAFAADPGAIRTWFYERTPYYDRRVDRYPVGCLDDAAVVAGLPLR